MSNIIAKIFNKRRLIVIDDVFPNLLTGFRIAEYNYYLATFPNTRVYTTVHEFREYYQEYSQRYPKYRGKIRPFKKLNLKGSLVYTVFINNIYKFLPAIERADLPFIFTLYPGGGFGIDNKESDEKLKKVFSSKFFRNVIVTQKISYDYLIRKNLCSKDKIIYILGGVLPSSYYSQNSFEKKYYDKTKKTFDICFVANKYTPKGIDKGYDIFVSVAKKLSKFDNIKFHVVGGFDENEISINSIKDNITFYGIKHLDFFPKFYSTMDIILSPNRPARLGKGFFDGFPTGSCVEASLAGVALFCTDELGMNVSFEDNKEIVIIPTKVSPIVKEVIYYYNNPDRLYGLSRAGQKKMRKVFNFESQMAGRDKLIRPYLEQK